MEGCWGVRVVYIWELTGILTRYFTNRRNMDKYEARQRIVQLLSETEKLIPKTLDADLAIFDNFQSIPAWHNYESEIWERGELIRNIFLEYKVLCKDPELMERIVAICLNRNSKRGRQSFIMLLWNEDCKVYAEKLISQLDDKFVYGHIIEGLNKMKASGYVNLVKPYCVDKITWIKNQAKKYVDQYGC